MSKAFANQPVPCTAELRQCNYGHQDECALTFVLSDQEAASLLQMADLPDADFPLGNRYLLYLLPLNGSERPLSTLTVDRLRQSLAHESLNRRAAVLCRDPHFWRFLQELDITRAEPVNERYARQFILGICRAESRRDLDINQDAGRRYRLLVEKPFLQWLGEDV